VISASHNPYYDNGIKFFSSEGKKLPDHLQEQINQELEKDIQIEDTANLGKSVRVKDANGRYIEFCKSTFPYHFDLRNLKLWWIVPMVQLIASGQRCFVNWAPKSCLI
jgi:phosphoglucosamine mutase